MRIDDGIAGSSVCIWEVPEQVCHVKIDNSSHFCFQIMVECVGRRNKVFPVHVSKTSDQRTRGKFQCQR